MRRPRRAVPSWPVLLWLLLFWALVLLGGTLEPGYSHVEDHVSRLASFGARAPAVGVAAIAALATAHATGALLLARLGARTGAAALSAAALSGYVVAVARIHCPLGAAGCRGTAPAGDAWTDTVHGVAVAAYEVALVTAMVATSGWALRRGRRALAAGGAVLAAVSVVTVLRVGEPSAGADQRLWLAVSTVWLMVVAGLAQLSPRRAQSGAPS